MQNFSDVLTSRKEFFIMSVVCENSPRVSVMHFTVLFRFFCAQLGQSVTVKFAYILFNSGFPCKLGWLVPVSSSSTFSERECLGIRGAGRFCGMNWRQNKHKVLNPTFLRSPPNSGRNGSCSLSASFPTPIPT